MIRCKSILDVMRSKSLRYILFRAWFSFEQKSGILERKFPTVLNAVSAPSLKAWRSRTCHYFFEERGRLRIPKEENVSLKESMNHILRGDVLFFSRTWKALGLDYDWVTNPETGFKYDNLLHWTKIESLSKEAGDIKYVWEKSRFSWLLTICRYDYHFNEDHSEFVFNQILDWIEKNPLNSGPNYKCSQETSIRLNNWIFALCFYRQSEKLTEERWSKIITSIYWQIQHVYRNINYSRIAVRNNHAITETLTLFIMGMMFPEMPDSKRWKEKGRRWFEKEIKYQIEEDGTYIQDSMNYHRVVVQLLSIAIAIAEKNGEIFSDTIYQRAWKSIDFLYQCQDSETGCLPNYGANDGALFFPLSDADYRDYRPQLDALHTLLTGQPLYNEPMEDTKWITSGFKMLHNPLPVIRKRQGVISFGRSGFYLIREDNCLTFIRCGNFKKQGTTDQLHLDIWKNGCNVLVDGGSFKYNTDLDTKRYFSGTESHNTVMLGDKDQMLQGPRFMWFYPTRKLSFSVKETETEFILEGSVKCFRYIGKNIILKRVVRKSKGSLDWLVVDSVSGKPAGLNMRQIWHWLPSVPATVESDVAVINRVGRYSSYYGVEIPSVQCECVTDKSIINTHIRIQ